MALSNTSPLPPFERRQTPGGPVTLAKVTKAAPIVAVDFWVHVGSRAEPPEHNGISHFLEHLFFKGTPKRPAGVMDRQIKALGGYNNAATSYDFTHYYVVLPSHYLEDGVDLLADAIFEMALPPDEIELERQVVEEEIRRKEDSPLNKLHDDFLQVVLRDTPYQPTVLGTFESLARIDRQAFCAYRERFYQPDNITVSAVGDLEPEKVFSTVDRMFQPYGQTHRQTDLPVMAPIGPVPSPHEFTVRKDVQQGYMLMGYRLPDLRGKPEETAMDVASTILGEGQSSRLVHLLEEQLGLVNSITAYFWALEYAGLLVVETSADPDDLPEARKRIEAEIARLANKEVGEDELEKAKTLLITGFAFSNEKASSLANTLGMYETVSSLDEAVRYQERVRGVTARQVSQVMQTWCRPEVITIGTVEPKR